MVTDREKALRMLWKDRCTVIVRQEHTDPVTKLTDFVETELFPEEPCKLSFETLTASDGDQTAAAAQSTKLFLDSELTVPAGSKIIVTRNGQVFVFSRSGEPGVFTHHQEIQLEKWKRWT